MTNIHTATAAAADLIKRCIDGHTEDQLLARIRELTARQGDALEILALFLTITASALIENTPRGPQFLDSFALRVAVDEALYDASDEVTP